MLLVVHIVTGAILAAAFRSCATVPVGLLALAEVVLLVALADLPSLAQVLWAPSLVISFELTLRVIGARHAIMLQDLRPRPRSWRTLPEA